MKEPYGFGKSVHASFSDAVTQVTDALRTEGFGVLTEIDVAHALKEKLGKEIPPYTILGACNPSLASRALAAEPSIGLLLPCNVVVRETGAGQCRVEFMNPNAVLDLVDRPEIGELAAEVRARLDRVLAAI